MGAGASRFRHGRYAGAGTGKRLETTHSAHLFVTPGGKGLLETEKRGKLRSYTAAMTREAYKNSETRDFLAQLYGGSIQNMVACMADGGGISPEELEALRAWLKERDPQ